jgi:hypothetical protein
VIRQAVFYPAARGRRLTKRNAPGGHVVLASADTDSFHSLRQPTTSRAERLRLGRRA